MAWFHFCSANHNKIGRSTLSDMMDWFNAGLSELGHKVTSSDHSVEAGAINIFWERFGPGMGETIASTGVTFGIVATEIPDGFAFNYRREPEWKVRFDSFAEVAKRASFIWTMVESTAPFYSQYCSTAYMELGFSERLIPRYIGEHPEHDFSFFGLRTPHREALVERLRRNSEVFWPDKFLSPNEVGELIGKTKIGLSFKQSAQWPISSPTRLGRLLMAKRGVAAEFVPIATRQSQIAGICPESSDYAEYALELLHSDWKARAEHTFDAYCSRMPMSAIVEQILDCTILGKLPLNAAGFHSTKINLGRSMADPPRLIGTRVIALEATMEERTRRLAALEASLEERTRRLAALEASLEERTRRLAALETIMEERTRRLATLEATLVERMRDRRTEKEPGDA